MNTHISDLFFARDMSACVLYDETNTFVGFSEESLLVEAKTFLDDMLFVTDIHLPTPKALVKDFLDRC